MSQFGRRLCQLALLTPMVIARAACPPVVADGQQVQQGPVLLAWRTEPATPQVGQPFVMTVTVCPLGASLRRVDASMPEHRHGMNYKPSLQPLGEGRWRVDGMLWHMAGRWELRWDVVSGQTTEALRTSVTLR
jgi:hypothetical protein